MRTVTESLFTLITYGVPNVKFVWPLFRKLWHICYLSIMQPCDLDFRPDLCKCKCKCKEFFGLHTSRRRGRGADAEDFEGVEMGRGCPPPQPTMGHGGPS